MSDWTRQFSLPDESTDESVFDTIVSAHGMAVATWLLDKHGSQIEQQSVGLVAFIRRWINTPGTADTPWDISFGRAHLVLKDGQSDAIEAAVRVGLRIARSGQPGQWSAQFSPASIQLDNKVIADVGSMTVSNHVGRPPEVVFGLSDGTHRTLQRDLERKTWAGDGAMELESVGINRPVYLIPQLAIPREEQGGEIFKECQPVHTITSDMARSFRDGFAVLGRNSPQYVPWVERVLSGIVVCPRQVEYRLVSGSWEDVPGWVHMSSPHRGVDIAEVLVHECAHQYFYMLQRLGPVDDASDRDLYWSPPIRKKRPLSRILMAYHALVNVQLLYAAIRDNEESDPKDVAYVRANEPDLLAAIEALDEPLHNNPALTKLGQGLYRPLADRMDALTATH